jgi:maleate cis-trans isomerase
VLVPWANQVVEAELPRWVGSRVAWHYARLVPSSGGTTLDDDFLAGLIAAVPAALGQLAALPLERVYLACTSAAFMYPGPAAAVAATAVVPLITAFEAIVAELQKKQVARIALLTPYPERVCEAEAAMFTDHGVTVTGTAALDLAEGYAAVGSSQVRALAGRVGTRAVEEAQVIVLSCTGWPTFGLVEELRRDLGRDVMSSNLAIVAHALRPGAGDR